MAVRRLKNSNRPGFQQFDADIPDAENGLAHTSVLELKGVPVRLSIDDEQLQWSVVDVSKDQHCLPLPSIAAKHKTGCPNATPGLPVPSDALLAKKVSVAIRDVLTASVGEPLVRSAPACCCGGPAAFTVHRLLVSVLRRQRLRRCVWSLVDVAFESTSQEVVRAWATAINAHVARLEGRPGKLLVVINPFGGAGAGRAVWERVWRRVFQPAGVRCTVVETQRQMHAHQVVSQLTASQLVGMDGIVAVGGDGLFHEVINGLMALREQGDERSLSAVSVRVGHIPAGSTDAVSCSLHGTRDETTAALHIAVGDRAALDMLRIDCPGDGGSHRYAVTMAAYGYLGDLMRESEGLRWLGPVRYELVGARNLFRGKTYRAGVRYLPADTQNADMKQVCGVNCEVCRQYRESFNRSTNFMANAASALQEAPDRWVQVEDDFVAIMLLIPPCRSNKSSKGVAPFNHLSDGKALLVLVRKCNPLQYAQFLLELSKVGACKGKFPFVDVVDVHALQVQPLGEQSSWNVDGELLPENQLAAQVHGALVDVFARGPDVKG